MSHPELSSAALPLDLSVLGLELPADTACPRLVRRQLIDTIDAKPTLLDRRPLIRATCLSSVSTSDHPMGSTH